MKSNLQPSGASVRCRRILPLILATFGPWCTQSNAVFQLDENGHLNWQQEDGLTLTTNGAGVTRVSFENPNLSVTNEEVAEGNIQPSESGIEIGYDWGHLRLDWELEDGVAFGTLHMENTSGQAIADFSIDLLRLTLSDLQDESAGFEEVNRTNLDHIALHSWKSGQSRVSFGLTSLDPPLRLRFQETTSTEAEGSQFLLRLQGGVHRMEDGGLALPIFGSARVPAGGNLSISFILKESATSVPEEVAEGIFRAKFYKESLQELNWPDRRPIGMIFVSENQTASNPKGLFWDGDLDATDPDAVMATATSFANRTVEALTELDAQGAIVWDIEGTDLPIWFVGDPRMLPLLNPQMDAVADTFFQILTDAGFETGVTIRPTQVYFDEARNEWRHGTGSHGETRNPLGENFDELWPPDLEWWRFFPLVERMDRKIQYAKDRWGCRIFYIDTNGVWREINKRFEFSFTLLNAALLRELMERHPDILLIPELQKENDGHRHLAFWGTSAPYGELDLGSLGTPAWIRNTYPDAFSILNVSDGDIEGNRDALVEAVRNGDILMARGWFKDRRNETVRAIYDEARQAPEE
jgi:hypothetical protein